jgi:hypothetical protein
MSKLKILGVALVAVFAVSIVVASTASAVEFLLALWLVGGVNVTSTLAVAQEGELKLEDAKTLLGKIPVLCSGILDGTVGPNSTDEITELLSLTGTAISKTVLVENGLACTDQSGVCGEPLVWAEGLPWKTELELMVDGTETFFVDLILNGEYYLVCMSSGLEDLCGVAQTAVKMTNEAGGVVDALFEDAFQTLAELKLGNCNQGGAESAIVEGLGTIKLTSGEALTVSSE